MTKKGTNLDKLTPGKENIKLTGHYTPNNIKHFRVNRADGTTDIIFNTSIIFTLKNQVQWMPPEKFW